MHNCTHTQKEKDMLQSVERLVPEPLSCDVSEVGLGAVLARRLRNLMEPDKMEF